MTAYKTVVLGMFFIRGIICLLYNCFYTLCTNFYNDDSALWHSCLNCCYAIIYCAYSNKCTVNSVHLNHFMLEWTLYSNGTSF